MATPTQIKRRGRLGLILGIIVAAVAFAAVAYADEINITNNLVLDTASATNEPGDTGTLLVYLAVDTPDSQNGCNATGVAPMVVSVTSSDTTKVTINSPGTVTLIGCGTSTAQSIGYAVPSGASEGNVTITASYASGGRGQPTATNTPDTFTVDVESSDTTAPVVTVPADITAEATGPSGAVVSFTASANDNVDGAITPTCTPASGSTFPLGTTSVTCSATDDAGNTGSDSFIVTVQDTTPPVVLAPADQIAEATSAAGAAVSYSGASATDIYDEAITPTCAPASGSTFPLGTTPVTCSATDSSGNTGSAGFTVTVQDTTPPVASAPADQIAEATSAAGAAVSYSGASAIDIYDGAITPICTPASGSTFPLGTTSVTCSATDSSGNTGSAGFTVTVQDTTAPTLTLPANITTPATGISGAVVTYSASASDLVDPVVPVSCSPASGSTFAPGTTTVNCSATDDAGNTATGSFTVTVRYSLNGFYQPVDMGGVYNSVKGGSTVPLKFEVFAGSSELTATSVVQSFVQTKIACDGGSPTDDIEFTTTGGTSLRYDATAGQFVQNWQTPKLPGQCYRVTLTTQDGSSLVAYFKLK